MPGSLRRPKKVAAAARGVCQLIPRNPIRNPLRETQSEWVNMRRNPYDAKRIVQLPVQGIFTAAMDCWCYVDVPVFPFRRLMVTIEVGSLVCVVGVLEFQTRMDDAKAILQPLLDARFDCLDALPPSSVRTTWQSSAASRSCICQRCT